MYDGIFCEVFSHVNDEDRPVSTEATAAITDLLAPLVVKDSNLAAFDGMLGRKGLERAL